MRRCSDRDGLLQQRQPAGGERQPTRATILSIGCDLQQAAPLQRLEIGGQRGPVHGQQAGNRSDRRRLRAVQRDQQRELAAFAYGSGVILHVNEIRCYRQALDPVEDSWDGHSEIFRKLL